MPLRCRILLAVVIAAAAAPGRAQEATAAEAATEALVRQLADPAHREDARRQLLAAGAAAVAPLVAMLGDADVDLVTAALGVLADLGPAAGRAFPRVFDLYCESTLRAPAALAAMAELAPWRPPDWTLTWDEVAEASNRLMREHDPSHSRQWARLAARFTFPREAGIDELVRLTRSRSPWRVQLAMQLLARRGAPASSALPALRDVLQRPLRGAAAACTTLRDDAAHAVLAIAADGELVALAHDQLAGRRPPPPQRREVPPRVRERIAALLGELAADATHDRARANLEALGEIAAGPLGDALATVGDDRALEAVLGALTNLGERGDEALPGLLAALPKRRVEHTASILRAITAIAPYGELKGEDLRLELALAPQPLFVKGRPIEGQADFEPLRDVALAYLQLGAALTLDPDAPITELGNHLDSADVLVRERALALLRTRDDGRELVPRVAGMLETPQPDVAAVHRAGIRTVYLHGIDRTPFVRRAAAAAVLALASPEDELATRARRVLAEAPPK